MRGMTAISCLMLLLGGCESQTRYDLRFVDAATWKPLDRVHASALLWGHHLNNRLFPADREETATVSGSDGTAVLMLTSGSGLWHYFKFQRDGYCVLTGQSSPSFGVWDLAYHRSDSPSSDQTDNLSVLGMPPGPVLIKMRPTAP
jgi:hypothetical protein